MANSYGSNLNLSLPTTTNFTALQYTAVTINSTGYAVAASSAGVAIGIIQNTPDGTNDLTATIYTAGQTKVQAGGTIAIGAQVQVGSSGTVVTYSSGVIIGVALTAGANGDVMEILLTL